MAVSSGYGGPNYAAIEGSLRNIAISYASIMSLQRQIAASIDAWRTLQRELALANAAAGGTADTLKEMEIVARSMALSTTFSASQVASAFYNLASAGLSVKESLQAIRGVTLLAQATLTDIGAASDIVAAALTQYSLAASDAYRVANLFVASANSSLSTIPKLAYALRQVGPIASEVGLSIEQTVGALDQLFQAGLRGQQAGTALRDIIQRIINPQGQESKLLEILHIDTLDAATGRAKSFLDIFRQIAALKPSPGIIEQIFGARGAVAAEALIHSLQGTHDAFDQHIKDISNTDAAYRVSVEQMKTVDAQLKLMQNNFNDLRITIGQQFAPLIGYLAQQMGNLTNTFKGMTQAQGLWYAKLAIIGAGSLAAFKTISTIGAATGSGWQSATKNVRDMTNEYRSANVAAGLFTKQQAAAMRGFEGLTASQSVARAGGIASAFLGLAGATLQVLALVAALYELYNAWNKVQDEINQARVKNVGDVVSQFAIQKSEGISSQDAQKRVSFLDSNPGDEFYRQVQLLNQQKGNIPASGEGAFQFIRQLQVEVDTGIKAFNELNHDVRDLTENAKDTRAKLDDAGKQLQNIFGDGSWKDYLTDPLGTIVVANPNYKGTNFGKDTVDYAKKYIADLNNIGVQQGQGLRDAISNFGQLLIDAAKQGLTVNAAKTEAAGQTLQNLAKNSNDVVLSQIGKALGAGATPGSAAQLKSKLRGANDALAVQKAASDAIDQFINEQFVLTPQQLQSKIEHAAQQRDKIKVVLDQLQKQIKDLNPKLDAELIAGLGDAAGLNDKQREELNNFFKSAQGTSILRDAQNQVEQGHQAMSDVIAGLGNQLANSKTDLADKFKKVIDKALTLPLITDEELRKLNDNAQLEFLRAQQALLTTQNNPANAADLAQKVALGEQNQDITNAIDKMLQVYESDTQPGGGLDKIKHLEGLSIWPEFLNDLQQLAQGDTDAGKKARQILLDGGFSDQFGQVSKLLDLLAQEGQTARIKYQTKLLDIAKQSIKDSPLDLLKQQFLTYGNEALDYAALTGNKQAVEVALDLAVKVRTTKIELDSANAIKQIEQKYADIFKALSIPVAFDANGAISLLTQTTQTFRSTYTAQQASDIGAAYRQTGPGTGLPANLLAQASSQLGPAIAKGFLAALYADSGGTTGFASNGAFGISQLRGVRQQEFFRRYGQGNTNPADQLSYAIDELTGKVPEKISGLTKAMRDAILNAQGDFNVAYQTIDKFLRPDLPGQTKGHQADIRNAAPYIGYSKVGGGAATTAQQVTVEEQRLVTKEVALTTQALDDYVQKQGESMHLTQQQIDENKLLAEDALRQINQQIAAEKLLRDARIKFVQDSRNATILAAADMRKALQDAFASTTGEVLKEQQAQAQDNLDAITERQRQALGRIATGTGTLGDSVVLLHQISQEQELATLEKQRVDLIAQIKAQMSQAVGTNGKALYTENQIDAVVKEINDEYAKRKELIKSSADFAREELQNLETQLQALGNSQGFQPDAIFTGLRAAVVQFAHDMPTLFETMRDVALTALNGVADIGAALFTRSGQNARQMVADMLRSMAQLIAKMLIMYAIIQLIRALPGGAALLSALDLGATAASAGAAGAAAGAAVKGASAVGTPVKIIARGGVMNGGDSNARILDTAKAMFYAAGGVANKAQMAIFGEGDVPEAYIPMQDRKTVPVRIDEKGNAFVPLAGGRMIPVSLQVASRKQKFATGGIANGQYMAADNVSNGNQDAVSRYRRTPGQGSGDTFNFGGNTINIQLPQSGDPQQNAAFAKQVGQAVDQHLRDRELENRKQLVRMRSNYLSDHGAG